MTIAELSSQTKWKTETKFENKVFEINLNVSTQRLEKALAQKSQTTKGLMQTKLKIAVIRNDILKWHSYLASYLKDKQIKSLHTFKNQNYKTFKLDNWWTGKVYYLLTYLGAWILTEANLKVVLAEFSTLSQAILLHENTTRQN